MLHAVAIAWAAWAARGQGTAVVAVGVTRDDLPYA